MVLSVSDGGPSPRSDLGSEVGGSTLGSRKRSAKARLAVVGAAPPSAAAGAGGATAEMVARMLEAQQKAHRQQIETMIRQPSVSTEFFPSIWWSSTSTLFNKRYQRKVIHSAMQSKRSILEALVSSAQQPKILPSQRSQPILISTR